MFFSRHCHVFWCEKKKFPEKIPFLSGRHLIHDALPALRAAFLMAIWPGAVPQSMRAGAAAYRIRNFRWQPFVRSAIYIGTFFLSAPMAELSSRNHGFMASISALCERRSGVRKWSCHEGKRCRFLCRRLWNPGSPGGAHRGKEAHVRGAPPGQFPECGRSCVWGRNENHLYPAGQARKELP